MIKDIYIIEFSGVVLLILQYTLSRGLSGDICDSWTACTGWRPGFEQRRSQLLPTQGYRVLISCSRWGCRPKLRLVSFARHRETSDYLPRRNVVEVDRLAFVGECHKQREPVSRSGMRNDAGSRRQRDRAGDHLTRRDGGYRGYFSFGRLLAHGFVDKRQHHGHNRGEQNAEIDDHEANQFAAHALRGGVERFLFIRFERGIRPGHGFFQS